VTPNDEGGIDLTGAEVEIVARRLIADLVNDAVQRGLICHEDVPQLSERSWVLVAEHVAHIARYAGSRVRDQDIDVDALMGQIQ